ncbi:hypothetical protein predicted by Glimmer/Critica [Sorangium cellulosum So ce56]|uniref:DUF3025 domain-containing protein n=1 Tax=Sorangium cellulosum (strain So ce56) TaxID=448385 RepID=A9G8T9_SORC5|nr:DUF3025 domain-containing protein [Sorangium cellulosum]CAN96037.1 hypothetical protein predicted by Glimmer/Critica [Sorangium cellulosum So ce56]
MSAAGRAAPHPSGAPGSTPVPWEPLFHEKSRLYWPIRPLAEAFAGCAGWPPVEDYNRALGEGFPVRFAEQKPRPRRRGRRGPVDPSALYDARIHVEGCVPTRPRNWHDFLNMLVWGAFPRAKAELHARQHRAIAARLHPGAEALPPARTRELDGLALLDEGGLLLLYNNAGEAPLLGDASDLERCAGEVRDAVQRGEAAALVFGHALYESLLQRGPTVYAMVQPIPCDGPLPAAPAALVALADARLGDVLRSPDSFARPERSPRLPLDERVLCK